MQTIWFTAGDQVEQHFVNPCEHQRSMLVNLIAHQLCKRLLTNWIFSQ